MEEREAWHPNSAPVTSNGLPKDYIYSVQHQVQQMSGWVKCSQVAKRTYGKLCQAGYSKRSWRGNSLWWGKESMKSKKIRVLKDKKEVARGRGRVGVPSKEECRCKGPEAWGHMMCLKNCKSPGVAGVTPVKQQVGDEIKELREVGRAWIWSSHISGAGKLLFYPVGHGGL